MSLFMSGMPAATTVATNGNTGYLDSFTQLVNGYFQFKTAEAQADAAGVGQQNLNNTVEQDANVNNQNPLNSDQYAGFFKPLQNNPVGAVVVVAAVVGLIVLIAKR